MLLRSQNLWKKQTFPNNPPTFLNYSFSSISLRTALENNIGSFLREALNSNTFFVLVSDQPYSFQTLRIWNIHSLESRRWQEAFPFSPRGQALCRGSRQLPSQVGTFETESGFISRRLGQNSIFGIQS